MKYAERATLFLTHFNLSAKLVFPPDSFSDFAIDLNFISTRLIEARFRLVTVASFKT